MSDRSPAPRRSRLTVEGLDRTSHRTFMRALGLDEAAMAKPFVGVMSTHGENTPCSLSLRPQAEAAKLGVAAAGGTPFEFTTISVSDGVSMGHRGMRMSLLSRELIADSIELVMRGHAYDALVGFAGCDKTLPGIMMGMVRLDCPSVFVYGGAMLPGQWHGRPVSAVTVYEGVGAVMAGAMTEADLASMELECAPTVGSCPGQFTANTMAMVSETLGLAVPGSAMLPAVYSQRLALARRAGEIVLRILADGGPLPRDLVTRKSLENACAAVAATGGSTNAGLHLPAIAHEAGIRFTLDDVAEVFQRTPLIANLQPGGEYLARDLHYAGGVAAVLKALLDGGYLHGDALALSGRTLAAELAAAPAPDGSVVRPASSPIHPTGRRRRAEGQSLPGRRPHQDRRAQVARLRRPRPRLRVRGGMRGRGAGPLLPRGRRARDPQRGAAGRPGHARDARRDRADLRPGHGREGRPPHRRALLGGDPRHVHRLCVPGGRRRRPHRAPAGRRPHRHRRPGPHRARGARRRRAARRRAAWQPRGPSASPAPWRNTPASSAPPTSAPSPTRARSSGRSSSAPAAIPAESRTRIA